MQDELKVGDIIIVDSFGSQGKNAIPDNWRAEGGNAGITI